MTTSSSVVYLDDTMTDAQLREYLAAISDGLAAVGCTQTADTGQYDPATVTWADVPGTTAPPYLYQMWYLNDSLHATAPIYFRLVWTNTGGFRLTTRAGTGSDGIGGVTGDTAAYGSAASTGTGGYGTVGVTGGDGYVGVFTDLGYSTGHPTISYNGFFLCRTTDQAGALTSDGAFLYGRPSSVIRNRRIDGGWVTPVAPDYTFVPGSLTSSHDPGQALNVYRHMFVANQQMLTSPFAVTVHKDDVVAGLTIDADPIVGQEHTYMATPWLEASPNVGSSSRLAVMWE